MLRATNEALVQVQRRAERVEASRLVATFVDAGPLFTLLSNTDHQGNVTFKSAQRIRKPSSEQLALGR
jgi:hypothetical protein